MISAYGAQVSVGTHSVFVEYSTLLAALRGASHRSIQITQDTTTTVVEPTALDLGAVEITTTDHTDSIVFSPGQQAAAHELAEEIGAVTRGEAPGAVPGLNFVAFDVETANDDWGSICQMGAVRFRDGLAKESRTWLCQPPSQVSEFDEENIAIHHITAADVATAAPCSEVIAEFLDFLGNDQWVAHFAQFDSTALLRAADYCQVPLPNLEFYCSLTLARAHHITFARHGLKYLAEDLGIPLSDHHNANADARACGEIISILARRDGFSGSLSELMDTYQITPGHIAGDTVTPVLVNGVQSRSKNAKHQKHAFPDPLQRPERSPRPRWQRAATPEKIPQPHADADPHDPLYQQVAVLSGEFTPHDKGELWQALAEHGAQVAKNVTKKTTILVAGDWEGKTSKVRRAEELQSKGQALEIWSPQQLYKALGYTS